jgi:hypothetical protein
MGCWQDSTSGDTSARQGWVYGESCLCDESFLSTVILVVLIIRPVIDTFYRIWRIADVLR